MGRRIVGDESCRYPQAPQNCGKERIVIRRMNMKNVLMDDRMSREKLLITRIKLKISVKSTQIIPPICLYIEYVKYFIWSQNDEDSRYVMVQWL